MRLATFNLMSGRSPVDGRADAARLHDAIATLDADVLALQEVDREQPRTGRLDLTAVAASASAAVASRFAASMVGTPGTWRPAVDHRGGPERYGVALVSRYPVRAWYERRFRASPVPGPIYVMGENGGFRMQPDEPRVVLAAVLDAPAGPMTVACTHLSYVAGWNVAQLARALRWIRRLPGPHFLLGDLNLPWPATWATASAAGWRTLARRPSYPVHAPRVQLDHVLAQPRVGMLVTRTWTPRLAVSDHRPLVVELMP